MNKIDKRYQKAVKLINKINPKDRREILKHANKILKRIDFKKLKATKYDMKSIFQNAITWFEDISFTDVMKLFNTLMISLVLYKLVKKTMNASFSDTDKDKRNLTICVMISIYASLIILILERYDIEVNSKKIDSDISKIFKQASENRKRLWEKFKRLDVIDFVEDFIRSSFNMTVMTLKWELRLAKASPVFAVAYSINIVANVMIVIISGKILYGKIKEDF